MAALRLGLLTLALHVFANSPATLFRLSRLSCLSNPLGSPRCPPRAHRWAPRARGGDRGDGAREYKEWRRLPLQPYGVRTTLMQEVARGKVYSLEQQLGVFNVAVNIRMTALVVDGGLMLVNPIAPTQECVSLVNDLAKRYGPVRYIVLPTTQVEHKVNLEPLTTAFPDAKVWVVGRQWSFPPFKLDLIGLYPKRIQGFLTNKPPPGGYPWGESVEVKVLDIELPGAIPTPFQEAALFHKSSRSLVVTDSVINVPTEPPPIVQEDPTSLLTIAGVWKGSESGDLDIDSAKKSAVNNKSNRQEGWAKTALLACFLSPSAVSKDLGEYIEKGFQWSDGWQSTFKALSTPSLVVSPLVSQLVFRPQAKKVEKWVDDLLEWPFQMVIPAHFSVARAGPKEFSRAFDFLRNVDGVSISGTLEDDYAVLDAVAKLAFGSKSRTSSSD
ncbi:hypothetical protein AAMO2058_001637000 [Amorphochlora amoebiformis]